MKKLNNLFKAGIAATAILLAAGNAYAAFPTQDDLYGTYTFKADVTVNDESYAAKAPAEFEYTISWTGWYVSLTNFLGTSVNINTEYNESTGALTLTQAYFSNNGYLCIGYDGVYDASKKLTFQYAEDGSVTCPDFDLLPWGSSTVVASYKNITITSPIKIGGDEGDEGDDTPSYPLASELAKFAKDYSVTSTLTMGDSYTAEQLGLSGDFDFTFSYEYFAALKNFIVEGTFLNQSEYDESKGHFIPMNNININGTAMLIVLAGEKFDGGYGNSADNPFYFQLNSDGTIEIPDFDLITNTNTLIASYRSVSVTSEDNGDDDGDDDGDENESPYPTADEIIGDYTFRANLDLMNSDYNLKDSYNFSIANLSGSLYVQNLCGIPSIGVTYNDETGEIKFNSGFQSYEAGKYYVFSEDGTYSTAYRFIINVEEDGTLTMPDFYIFSTTDQTSPVAHYSQVLVTKGHSEDVGGDEEDNADFAGTITLYGTTFNYTENADEPTVTNDYLTLVINEDNVLVSIQNDVIDYALTEDDLTLNKFNKGIVSGNEFILESGPYTVFNQTYVGEDLRPTGYYLNNYATGEFNQGNEIVLTKNEDDTYGLTEFTIWHRYWDTVAGEDGQSNTAQVSVLLYRWVQGETQAQITFEGSYELAGTMYNYESDGSTVKSDGAFTLVINENNQFESIGGYTLDQWDLADDKNAGEVDGNKLVLTAGIWTGVYWEDDLLLLSDSSTESYNAAGTIAFTKTSDEEYSLSPFTIWRRTVGSGFNFVYTLVSYWDPEPYQDGIESIAIDAEGAENVEFFNLQGIRVLEPAAGNVYIRRQGNEVSKVLVK